MDGTSSPGGSTSRRCQLAPAWKFILRSCGARVDGVGVRTSLPSTQEMAAKDENLGMPSMTAELSKRAVLSVAASVVDGSKQGDISDAVKSRLLV